jgi:carboxypeptidase Taq
MSYQQYVDQCRKIADIQHSMAVLQWDQEVNMPPAGAEARGRQIATLSVIAHDWFTDPKFGDLLNELKDETNLSPEQKRNVSETLRDYTRQKKYPSSFVERMSLATSKAFNAWQNARKNKDFSLFQEALAEVVNLKKEEVDLVGYDGHPYNALADEFEPGISVERLDELFAGVRTSLSLLLDKVKGSNKPSNPFSGKKYPHDQQWALGMDILKKIGYDFNAGRQDLAPHPFCITFSQGDVRVTTRVNEEDVFDMLSSCIHEGGHAIYEQGLLAENYGLPAGQAISLGIHESQSRLWENNVGRSAVFWKFQFPFLQKAFPQQTLGLTAKDAFIANNLVEPSLIRVQADELTYHFHIMIRYELEKALISGDLQIADLPGAWNDMYLQYLGVKVPDDAQGVLQDIHWSHGSIGYFPTYTLGSFYAAQFYAAAQKQIDGLETMIANGEFQPLKLWLNENIHRYGKRYTADEICQRVTGETLNYKYFHDYLSLKLGEVYGW